MHQAARPKCWDNRGMSDITPNSTLSQATPKVGFVSLGCAKDSQYKPLQEHMKGLAYVVSNALQLNRE